MDRIGKYEILDKIGTGGFAVVYKGYDPFIKRPVAIKVCYSRDAETRERFHREAEIAGRLEHRHITTVYDFGIHEQMPYLVEEYLPGEDLAHMIRREEPEDTEEKLEFLMQIASGMAHAHNKGVIHRDIKPSNIRVLDNGRVKIMDFGTAKLTNVESNLTQTGMTLGTVAYLSPERLLGQPSGINSDIFSYGVLAYELLSFRRPFTGRSIPNLIDQVLNASPMPLQESWPECPPKLADVVHKCLHKDPALRYAICDEVLEDLEEVRTGQNVTTPIGFHESSTSVVVPPAVFQTAGMLQRARQHFAAGKYERAKVLLDEVLEIHPNNRKALQLLEECREATGETEPAPKQAAPPKETPDAKRSRKVDEAIRTIENYLGSGELGKAASALKFAAHLFGSFETGPELRRRLIDLCHQQVNAVREEGRGQAQQILSRMGELGGALEPEPTRALAEIAADLDPENEGAGRFFATEKVPAEASDSAHARKQAEAIASIEQLIEEGNPAMAEQALRFAIRLLGEFDQISDLRYRIDQAMRRERGTIPS